MKQRIRVIALSALCLTLSVTAQDFMPQTQTPKQEYRDINAQSFSVAQAQQPSETSAVVNLVANQQPVQQKGSASNATIASPALTSTEIADVKLTNLTQKTAQLIAQVAELNQTVAALSQRVQGAEFSDEKALPTASQELISALPHLQSIDYATLGGISFIFIGLGFLMGRTGRRQAKQPVSNANEPNLASVVSEAAEDVDTKAEYDFMATEEAIPAMLDLARSYVAMDNFLEAKTVLEEVVKRGDAAQSEEAQDLLNIIEGKTKAND